MDDMIEKMPNQSVKLNNRSMATKKDKSSKEESPSLSYFERKIVKKQLRVEAYKHKLERAVRIKTRRDNSPNGVKKDEFRSWWDGRRAYEEQMNRKARQLGMDWTIKVATVVERLPVVMPDKEPFEIEFENLQSYLKAHSGKEYPKEFLGNDGGSRPEAYTDEELMGTSDKQSLAIAWSFWLQLCLLAFVFVPLRTVLKKRIDEDSLYIFMITRHSDFLNLFFATNTPSFEQVCQILQLTHNTISFIVDQLLFNK